MRRKLARVQRRAQHEAGFFMIEAIVAIGLIALCAGTIFAAIVAVQHQSVRAQPSEALTLSAQNVLTDLRVATAYDAAELAALAGRSTSFDVTEPAPNGSPQPLHVDVLVARPDAGGMTIASVTVRNARGQTATVRSALVQEAPAPGSVVPASTPVPDPAVTDAGTSLPSPSPQSASPCEPDRTGCRRADGAIPL